MKAVTSGLRGSMWPSTQRSPHWLKMKCEASQELVVGGFTDSHFFRDLGITSYGYTATATPLQDAGGVHGNDERVSELDVRRGVAMTLRILERFAAIERLREQSPAPRAPDPAPPGPRTTRRPAMGPSARACRVATARTTDCTFV